MAAFTPEQLLPMITAAINAGDPREVVKYFDEQGCFALPDGALARGHDELLVLYEQRLAFRPKITARAAKIIQVGDIALVTNEWSTRLRSGEMNGEDSFEGIATLVLRRHADHGWRILVDST